MKLYSIQINFLISNKQITNIFNSFLNKKSHLKSQLKHNSLDITHATDIKHVNLSRIHLNLLKKLRIETLMKKSS